MTPTNEPEETATPSRKWDIRPFSDGLSQVWIGETLLVTTTKPNCAILETFHNDDIKELESRAIAAEKERDELLDLLEILLPAVTCLDQREKDAYRNAYDLVEFRAITR